MAKQWSSIEKLNIINESYLSSIGSICKKYEISKATVIRWRSELKSKGEVGLEWGNGSQARVVKKRQGRAKKINIHSMTRNELIEYIELCNDIKKYLLVPIKKKFRVICDLRQRYSVKWMCAILEVSHSGFYAWAKNGYEKYNKWNKTTANIIMFSYIFFKKVYGYKMLTKLINKFWDLTLREHVVYRYMKNMAIKSVVNKKSRFRILESAGDSDIPNLLLKINKRGELKRNFRTTEINQVWVTDITYLLTNYKPYYLTIVRDIHNGEIIDWSISNSYTIDFALNNLRQAWFKRGKPKGTIIHSDHSFQYTHKEWAFLATQQEMKLSMSRVGNSPDNGCCKTWFKSFKYECLNLIKKAHRSEELLNRITKNYVDFYNNYRPLGKLKGMSPIQYRLAHS